MQLPLVVTAESHPDGWTVVTAAGELDLSTFSVLDEQHRVHTRNETPVRLDLSKVSFIDSSGLAAVILAKKRSDEHGVPLRIEPISDFVRSAFRMAGVIDWLNGDERAIRRIEAF